MALGSIISGGLGIIGGLIGASQSADAADDAARAEERAAQQRVDLEREIFEQSRADLEPWRRAGVGALQHYANMFLPGGWSGIERANRIAELQDERDELERQINAGVIDADTGTARMSQLQAQLDAFDRGYQGYGGFEGAMRAGEIGPQQSQYYRGLQDQLEAARNDANAQGITRSRNRLAKISQQLENLQGASGDGGAGASDAGPDFSAFYKSPGYQFRLDEGQRALERSQAARGKLMGGETLRKLTDYAQGVSQQYFNDYANRIASLANTGQVATTQTGQFGQNFARSAGSALQDAGTARASGYVGQANAWNRGLENVTSGLAQMPWNRMFPNAFGG